jgi:hypothetical protein
MRPFSIQLGRLVLGWVLGLGVLPLAGPADPPTPTGTPLDAIQLRVLLRAAPGQPVPGIAVNLLPVPSDLGGPAANTAVQHGQTDATGAALFTGLQGAIWRLTFTGSYVGQPLQAVAEQGQPPYGTTRGGGFVVQTSLHEENAAPAPVVSVPAPPIETLAFVLLPTNGRWTPAIDLAAPAAPPQPLSLLKQAPVRKQFYIPEPVQPAGDERFLQTEERNSSSSDSFTFLWLVPALVAGLVLLRLGQARNAGRQPSGKQAGTADDRGSA